jgi:hypothetical protein
VEKVTKCPKCNAPIGDDSTLGSWQWCRNPQHKYWSNGGCSCLCECGNIGTQPGELGPLCKACADKKCLKYKSTCQCPCGCRQPAVKTVIYRAGGKVQGGAFCADCIRGQHGGG